MRAAGTLTSPEVEQLLPLKTNPVKRHRQMARKDVVGKVTEKFFIFHDFVMYKPERLGRFISVARRIDPLIHFLKGRVMVPVSPADRKLDPLPPCLAWVGRYKRSRTCNNIHNAERVPQKIPVFISVPQDRHFEHEILLEICALNSVQIGVQTIV